MAAPGQAVVTKVSVHLAQEKWKSSGLSDKVAAKLKLTPLNGPETAALDNNFHAVTSLKIPYFDLDGKQTEFFRVRYLERLPGFAGLVDKPQRYAQKAGTLNEVYLPPLLPSKWRDVANDVKSPLYITEGELKAAAGASVGLAVLGLGGVDVWQSKKRALPLLPVFDEFAWKGRSVTIVFDSDSAEKPGVVGAQTRLARALLALGAEPCIASIPSADDGRKQGLDDLLVSKGEKGLLAVVQDAPMFPEAEALWNMNDEVCYIRDPGLVVVREEGRVIKPEAFTAHAYANRHFTQMTQTQNGVISKRKPLAKHWLEWEHRFELGAMCYEPGKPRVFENKYNQWTGWGCEPKKGDVDPWCRLLDFLFKKEDRAREWFEQWVAYPIQHPGVKLYTSVLVWGLQQRTGKTLAGYMLKKIYGVNAIEIGKEQLRGSFNPWATNRQFVIGNEITEDEGRLDKDKLKHIVTRDEAYINRKNLPEYTVRDCVNYYFTANSPGAFFMEDFDQRNFIHEVLGAPEKPEFYAALDRWYKGSAGPAALFHYLLHDVNTTGFNPLGHALNTKAKDAMIYTGKSDLGVWVVTLKEDPEHALAPLGEKLAKKCELFTPNQLLRAYDPDGKKKVTAPGLAREMLRSGFKQVNAGSPVHTKAGAHRLYAVRNGDHWFTVAPPVAAKHFEQYWGPDAGKF